MPADALAPSRSLATGLGIEGLVVMYVGNLEPYQGIDLLLESFARVLARTDQADLVIVGGAPRDVQTYGAMCRRLGIAARVHLLGPRPVSELAVLLAAADVLVSPRLRGNNTPMKLYSYLHSGKALVATDLPTHTQVVDDTVAVLAAPMPDAFADALTRVIIDAELRSRVGVAGRRLIEEHFTYQAFRQRLNGLLDWLETQAERFPG